MPTCNLCHRSGIFLKITKVGVCSTCEPGATLEITSRWKVIDDSMRLVSKSKNIDTRISRCDDLLNNADALLRYEQAGVRFKMPPSGLIQTYTGLREVLVAEDIKQQERTKLAKAKRSVSKK